MREVGPFLKPAHNILMVFMLIEHKLKNYDFNFCDFLVLKVITLEKSKCKKHAPSSTSSLYPPPPPLDETLLYKTQIFLW